ncbi:MAG: CvpA family protein [Firmicutes bacterium]|nr:CvpA family protein [Bacillota bacterium]
MGIVDICAIGIIILGTLIGLKKGAIKSFVQLVGMVAIVIVAYQFKGYLGDLLIKIMPFFNFGGAFNELYSLNLLLYQGIAFAIIFILLYCILNILINLSGILDLLVKLTIVLELPSKIIGAILGAVEALVFVFVGAFVLLQNPATQKHVMESKFTIKIVQRTPVVYDVFRKAISASEEIYEQVKMHQENGNMLEANLEIIRSLVKYDIVKAEVVQGAINSGKMRMPNVVVAS